MSRAVAWRHLGRATALTGLSSLLMLAPAAFGATIVVNNLDAGSGLGFDDPTAVAPVAGNPGVTLGEQRLNAFEAAAAQWAEILVSPVTIQVDASMPTQPCGPTSGVLGSAGTNTLHGNFANAPLFNTWYPQALANSLAGSDLSASADLSANFNRAVDNDPNCLTNFSWSYVIGVDNPPNTFAFTNTVLHEIGHGIGVAGFTSLTTGALFSGFPDHYGSNLFSETLGLGWIELSDAERLTVAADTGNLTWSGPEMDNVDDFLSAGVQASGRTRMYAPASIAPGSSVNHFDTALTPNELMEPFDTDVNEQLLTNHLLLDVGWRLQLALPVSLTDGATELTAGDATSYDITVQNDGPGNVRLVNATVSGTLPNLVGAAWTCSGSGGGSCGNANGTGAITDEPITLPLGGSVTFTVTATLDPAFSGTLNASATLTPPDNIVNTALNTAEDATNVLPLGIDVSPQDGLVTDESGATDSFTVVLQSQPGDDVTIGISSSDETEGTVSPGSLVFTSGNWDQPQQVTVTGADDPDMDGNVAYTLITAPAVSTDGNFNGLDAPDVAATNLDDDTPPGFIVSAISGNTTETGGTATFTIAPTTVPSSAVTIGLSSSDPGEGTVPAQVVLPAGSFASQTVTVTGADDTLDDGDVGYTIVTATAASSDGAYDGIDPGDVAVINEDDDFLVGGTVSGVIGDGITLRNNGADDLAVTLTGPFSFPTAVADGGSYAVTVVGASVASGLKCFVTDGAGVVNGADVTSVNVNCVETCNIAVVPSQTVSGPVDHEACESLAVGPDYVAEPGAEVFLSSGEEILLLPGFQMQEGATLDAAVCGQSLCQTSGDPMPDGCHSCVVDLCTADPFCCDVEYDQICLDQLPTVCGLVCD